MIIKATFKHFFILSASAVVLVGCGNRKNDNSDLSQYTTSLEMTLTQDLQTAERDIATRICYAYKSKNISFRTPTYTSKFYDFDVNTKDCSDKQTKVSITTTIKVSSTSSSTLIFTPIVKTEQEFFQKVQTSSSGFLSQLCSKIQSNQAISNTIYDSDTDSTVQIKFFKDELDSYTLNYYTKEHKDKDGKMLIASAETFKVRTQFNISTNQVLGMDESILKQITCTNNPKKHSEFIQTFSGHRQQ